MPDTRYEGGRCSFALRSLLLAAALAAPWFSAIAFGSSWIAPGDAALRADIQLLADNGIVRGPVTSWPLAWDAVLADIDQNADESALPAGVLQALTRVRRSLRRE